MPPHDPRSPVWPRVNPEYAQRLIPIVLRAVGEYGQKLSLSIPRPLTTNRVARFSLKENSGGPYCELELTNGWRFLYEHSMVTAYHAPDNLFASDQRPILIKEFVGKWNMTEAEAIDLVSRTLAKLNYPTNLVHLDFAPQVQKPALPGIPRYMFYWYYERNDELKSTVMAEVDADKRELKSLYYGNKSYWNQRPPIDVPILLPVTRETNASQPLPKSPRRPLTPYLPRGARPR